ncbi:MAG: chromosome segregation protein SMC [Anaerolineae bacterium]|nr:chromosome segregation protein SMC [Anaerolineae bacterium]
MRLKRLYLQGYKTFANRTEFLFDEGITAIVGPNGSGKSNIADAIRWVLGEQSFRELRGRRSTDMIFTGSQQRARAGMAHVSLLLDNSQGELPIDYTEVEIARRVYRDGSSEYYLNGNKVRLREINALLATSGLAGRSYTMIGQGLVDRALSLKADERRALFEEAAGISHYKDRREQTLRHLHETQRNLERVNDVLEEIRPRLRSLKRQAGRARDYEQVYTDLRALLRVWYGYRWHVSRKALRQKRELSTSAEISWRESRRVLAAEQQRLEQLRLRLNEFQQQIHDQEDERDQVRSQVEQLHRRVAILRERQALSDTQLAELAGEIPDLEQQQAVAQQDLAQAMADLEAAQADLQAEQAELAAFDVSFKEQQSAVERWRSTVAELERKRQSAQQKHDQLAGQLTQLGERLQERRDEVVDAAVPLKMVQRIEQLTAGLDALVQQHTAIQAQLSEKQAQQQDKARLLKQWRREETELRRQLEQLGKDLARLETRRDMLSQMRQKSVKISGDVTVIGRLAQLLTIPPDLTVAIEAALSARLGALIVPDETALWQLVEQNRGQALIVAAQQRLSIAAALPAPDHPAVIGWAHDLVSAEKEAAPIVAAFLNRTLVVADAAAAFDLVHHMPAGVTLVALDGLVVHSGGIVETHSADNGATILQQERDWRDAVAAVAAIQQDIVSLQAEIDAKSKTIAAEQESLDSLNRSMSAVRLKEQENARGRTLQQRDLELAQQQLAVLERQSASRDDDIERLTKRIAQIERDSAELIAANEIIDAELETARAALAALPMIEAEQQRTARRQSIEAAGTIVAGRRAVADSRRATLGQIESRLRRQQARQTELRRQKADIDLAGEEQQLHALQLAVDTLDTSIKPLRDQRAQLVRMVTDLEADIAVRQRRAHQLETEYTEARVAFAQAESRLDGLKERIHADFGVVALSHDDDETVQEPLPIGELVEQLPVVDELPEDLEESIQKRRAQLQRMGAINPDAPQEYDETFARVEFMEQQLVDLKQTEEQLRGVIADLDELTSREFVATVERVNVVFGDLFRQLFGGGSAELILTDPDDLTVSGVDIVARLPRRREQGLAVLSGGERSLTAAALVFSLLTVSPPPFCVMDEVDAALDEANITRFRDVLRELSLRTQFIVITHNRGTVQAANTLYGISMGSDSTSQVISMRMEDYVEDDDV